MQADTTYNPKDLSDFDNERAKEASAALEFAKKAIRKEEQWIAARDSIRLLRRIRYNEAIPFLIANLDFDSEKNSLVVPSIPSLARIFRRY